MSVVCFRPLSGSYISQYWIFVKLKEWNILFPSPIGELHFSMKIMLNIEKMTINCFRPLSGSYISQSLSELATRNQKQCFRPLSGSYISQYHLRNPMSCLGRIGGLRGKSNFIEMQPFWKVKNSHKSNI